MTVENVGIIISITALLAVIGSIFKFGEWYGKVNSDRQNFSDSLKDIRGDIKNIRDDIKDIRDDIKNLFDRLPPSSTVSLSPIQLTELGERISEYINAKEWAATEADKLVAETKDMNAFEIQTLSFNHSKSFIPNKELLQKMQNSAYESGINLDGVKDVLGVELRDLLLQMNDVTRSSLDK